MPFPDGVFGSMVLAVQPANTRFSPPLRVRYPNTYRNLSPGETARIFSFSHDLGRYIDVGSGTVSPDGSTIVSNPGVGIRVGAWHVIVPPDPVRYGCIGGVVKASGEICLTELACYAGNTTLDPGLRGSFDVAGIPTLICNIPIGDPPVPERMDCRARERPGRRRGSPVRQR
jgi:hypothetical protein